MRIQVIQLEQNDDQISVGDKLRWSQAAYVVLVWPKHGHVLNQRIELNLVKRQAEKNGIHLALITADREVRYLARKLGIPLLSHPTQVRNMRWEASGQAGSILDNEGVASESEMIPQSAHPDSIPQLEDPAARQPPNPGESWRG